jgi:arginase
MYVHLDLDVLDPEVAAANRYAVSGGLTIEDVECAISQIAHELPVAALTLSAYDPAVDTRGEAGKAAIRLICTAAGFAERA